MVKDENPKAPPFQLFQQPSKKAEPLPSEKTDQPRQPPQQFQQPPKQSVTPPFQKEKVKNQSFTNRGETTAISSNAFGNWVKKNRKWLGIGSALVVCVFLLLYIVLPMLSGSNTQTDEEAHPATQTKKEKPSANSKPPIGYGYIRTKNDSALNLREGPSETAKAIVSIPNLSVVKIMDYDDRVVKITNGETGQWCRVDYKGKEGWVWGGFVERPKK